MTAELLEDLEDGEGRPWRRCRLCGRPGPHDEARLAAELEGRARMAAARRHVGAELDRIDRIALEAFPDPRSGFRMTP